MELSPKKKAAVYCRVSTREQVDEGNSLATQERHCREYAERNGYEVADIYIEKGESAKTADRTQLQRMILECGSRKSGISAIIVYKIDRLSRNTDDYSQLRLVFKRYGIEIKSVTEQFENNPAGRFMENMMANVAQFDNDVRAERCAGGMKSAMREGRYVWMAPLGYQNVRVAGRATIAPDPVAGPLVKEMFRLLAKNLYPIDEVRRIMIGRGLLLRSGKPVTKAYFYSLVRNPLYTGLIEKFGEKHQGLFEPLADEETFRQVQRVVRNRGRTVAEYKLDNPDFPLRRFVWDEDGRRLSGSWSTGRSKKYPFYRFVGGGNFGRDSFEKQFIDYLSLFELSNKLLNALRAKVKKRFREASARDKYDAAKLREAIQSLQNRQGALIRKNLDGFISDAVLKQQLDQAEAEILDLSSKLVSAEEGEIDVDAVFDVAEQYLKNPGAFWKSSSPETKIRLQWFQFPKGLVYENGKFRTTETALIFNLKSLKSGSKSSRVDSGLFFTNHIMVCFCFLNQIVLREIAIRSNLSTEQC